jgi:hypothetical protein
VKIRQAAKQPMSVLSEGVAEKSGNSNESCKSDRQTDQKKLKHNGREDANAGPTFNL